MVFSRVFYSKNRPENHRFLWSIDGPAPDHPDEASPQEMKGSPLCEDAKGLSMFIILPRTLCLDAGSRNSQKFLRCGKNEFSR
jgi:hypothetical protein